MLYYPVQGMKILIRNIQITTSKYKSKEQLPFGNPAPPGLIPKSARTRLRASSGAAASISPTVSTASEHASLTPIAPPPPPALPPPLGIDDTEAAADVIGASGSRDRPIKASMTSLSSAAEEKKKERYGASSAAPAGLLVSAASETTPVPPATPTAPAISVAAEAKLLVGITPALMGAAANTLAPIPPVFVRPVVVVVVLLLLLLRLRWYW